MSAPNEGQLPGLGHGEFRTTHWSIVLAAGCGDEVNRPHALEELCRAYWYPVYAFVRRRGYDVQDAQDLTQGFFAHALEREMLTLAQREKGRFRSFLLGALKNFLGYEARKQATLKRGGGDPRVERRGGDDLRVSDAQAVWRIAARADRSDRQQS